MDFTKLHDDMLSHEQDISSYVEMLTDKRIEMYDNKDFDEIKTVIPILNSIIEYAKDYKEWLLQSDKDC